MRRIVTAFATTVTAIGLPLSQHTSTGGSGPVQVALTVAGATITAADAVQVASGNQNDHEINAVAVPILDQEVVAAQSAQVDTVSGATVTSDGYLASLQSAIDQAHL
ncbi:MAG: FMN-binding protein [Rhodoferax sp.]|nr:FMN-binding protein [Actinomycetota bacterium]